MDSGEVKRVLRELGADLCGIAGIDRFDGAPEGFHPRDVMPSCKSVVVFAKRFPAATIRCKTTVPYTIARNILSAELDRMSVAFCAVMEHSGVAAVPTGAISHSQYDEKTGRWRGIVSAKHCAVAAGLGRIGRNTLVTTQQFGNMVWLCVVLTDAELDADDVLIGDPCPEGCTLCVDNCPAHALGAPEMQQQACSDHAFYTPQGREFQFQCHRCRTICPNCLGKQNACMDEKQGTK